MKTTINHWDAKPRTTWGRWSVWLAASFTLLFIINIPINLYQIQPIVATHPQPALYAAFILFMLACGVIAGILGGLAITKRHERSWQVWVSAVIGLFALLIFLNEALQGIWYLLGS